MSEDHFKTADLPSRRLTELLTQDQGCGQVRISHAQGTPLVGDGQTQTSPAFETWGPKESMPVHKLVGVQADEVFLSEARKLDQELKTKLGHSVDVRTSYVLEYQPPKAPTSEEPLEEPQATKMRAVASPKQQQEPEQGLSWATSIIFVLFGVVVSLIVAWVLGGQA